MEKKEYQKMANFEENYWWHKGKKHLVEVILDTYFNGNKEKLEILEIGCGTGGITKELTKWGKVTGVDTSKEAIEICRKRGISHLIVADFNNLSKEQLNTKFDLILALDVLEHIQDDIRTLKKVRSYLKKNGYFFASVPAHKFLWSEHDEALHHKRRYHSLEITHKLKDTGFNIVKKTYFVVTAFPVIAFYRIAGNFFKKTAYPKTSYIQLPELLNNLMVYILKMEATLIRKISFPIGTTIVIVAKN